MFDYKTKELIQRRSKHLSSSLKVFYPDNPLHIVRAEKQFMFDNNDRRYLDCINNVCHVGHSHPYVVNAASKQLAMLNTNTRFVHENIVNYAERLSATLPEPLNVCFFVCSGSEANDLALRLARVHTGNKAVFCLEEAYHGTTAACQDISSYQKYKSDSGKDICKLPIPDTYRGMYIGEEDAGWKYAQQIKYKAQEIPPAAFICESALSCAGQIILPKNYLKHAYHYARSVGAVCIADEVQTGFGRFGSHYWAFEDQDVIPDIVTMGKAMGNGFPLAAVVTTPEIEQSLIRTGLQYFNTCGGNPVACAVGLAVLDVVRDEHLQQNALVVGKYLLEKLKTLKDKYSLIGDVRGRGLFLGIELVKNRSSKEPAVEETKIIYNKMYKLGILLSIDGPYNNVLKIKPPICFTKENCRTLVEGLEIALKAICSGPSKSYFFHPNQATDFVNEQYIRSLANGSIIKITPKAIITPLARDLANSKKIQFIVQ